MNRVPIVAAALIAAVGLAACERQAAQQSSASAAPPSAASAAASAASAASSAAAAALPAEPPAQFVQRLFAVYAPNSLWWNGDNTLASKAYTAKVYADFYDPGFVKVMNDNGTLAGQKGGGVDLDSDPVCECQDSGGHYVYVSGAMKGQFFDANIKITDSGETYTLVLAPTPAGWRIYDVIDSSGDVRAWLTQHNDCLRAAKTEAAGEKCIGG